MNDGVHIIGHGVLKGKVNWKIVSNGDGTETVTISSIELYSYTYTNAYQNQAVNQNITSTFMTMTVMNYFRFTMTAIRHSQRQSIKLLKLTRLSKSHQMRLVL